LHFNKIKKNIKRCGKKIFKFGYGNCRRNQNAQHAQVNSRNRRQNP
jgi:hypothetical protein